MHRALGIDRVAPPAEGFDPVPIGYKLAGPSRSTNGETVHGQLHRRRPLRPAEAHRGAGGEGCYLDCAHLSRSRREGSHPKRLPQRRCRHRWRLPLGDACLGRGLVHRRSYGRVDPALRRQAEAQLVRHPRHSRQSQGRNARQRRGAGGSGLSRRLSAGSCALMRPRRDRALLEPISPAGHLNARGDPTCRGREAGQVLASRSGSDALEASTIHHATTTDTVPVVRSIRTAVPAGSVSPAMARGSASSEATISPSSLNSLLFRGTPRTRIVWPCPEPMLTSRPSLAIESVTPGGAVVASAGM